MWFMYALIRLQLIIPNTHGVIVSAVRFIHEFLTRGTLALVVCEWLPINLITPGNPLPTVQLLKSP